MKQLRIILCALVCTMMFAQPAAAKVNKQQVMFYVDLHCQGCIDKIYKTIAYEKGVKDLDCNLDKKTVIVTYDANKTDVQTLQKAFAAIGKPATTEDPAAKKCCGKESCSHGAQGCSHQHGEGCSHHHAQSTDATTGATQTAK